MRHLNKHRGVQDMSTGLAKQSSQKINCCELLGGFSGPRCCHETTRAVFDSCAFSCTHKFKQNGKELAFIPQTTGEASLAFSIRLLCSFCKILYDQLIDGKVQVAEVFSVVRTTVFHFSLFPK